jgi:hypothetical protein
MPEKRIEKLFPQFPSDIELVLYDHELPRFNMDAHVAKSAEIFNPNTDIWLQLLHVPENLRYGSTGVHYGTEILKALISKYRNKARRICFCLDPRNQEDFSYVQNFYKDHFGFKINNDIPGYTFGYLDL